MGWWEWPYILYLLWLKKWSNEVERKIWITFYRGENILEKSRWPNVAELVVSGAMT